MSECPSSDSYLVIRNSNEKSEHGEMKGTIVLPPGMQSALVMRADGSQYYIDNVTSPGKQAGNANSPSATYMLQSMTGEVSGVISTLSRQQIESVPMSSDSVKTIQILPEGSVNMFTSQPTTVTSTDSQQGNVSQNEPRGRKQKEPGEKPKPLCCICNREFSKFHNLKRHQRKCHPVYLSRMLHSTPYKVLEKKEACNLCQKTFARKNSVVRHKKKFHNIDVSLQTQDALIMNDQRKYICDKCKKGFKRKSNYNKHKLKTHGIAVSPTLVKHFKCPLCDCVFQSRESFNDHLNKLHNLLLDIESHEFEHIEDFKKWKCAIERETESRYFVKSTYKLAGGLLFTLYACHRTGKYRSKGIGIRKRGTYKLEYHCPASISVTAKGSEKAFPAQIKFISTHVGHKCEIGKQHLSKSKKDKLTGQIPPDVQLQDFLISTSKNESSTKGIADTNIQDLSDILNEYRADFYQDVDDIEIDDPTENEKKVIEEGLIRSKNFREETKNILLGFIDKSEKYTSQEQCALINRTIAMLTRECEALAEKGKVNEMAIG